MSLHQQNMSEALSTARELINKIMLSSYYCIEYVDIYGNSNAAKLVLLV